MERITKAPLKQPDRSDITMEEPVPAVRIELPEVWKKHTLIDKATEVWRWTTRLTPPLVSLIWGILMRDLKTTITAGVAFVAGILSLTGVVDISANLEATFALFIVGILGMFSADSKKPEGE